jgi:hypothetical protein
MESLSLRAFDPGSPPSKWRHPYDHFVTWPAKKAVYDSMIKQQEEVRREIVDTECKFNQLIQMEGQHVGAKSVEFLKSFTSWLWHSVVRVVLHVLLLLAVISFGWRVLLRFLLIRGKFGAVRV